MDELILFEFDEKSAIKANDKGIVISNFRNIKNEDIDVKRLSEDFNMLIEQEVAEEIGNDLIVETERIYELYNPEYSISEFLPEHCPYLINVESTGSIGRTGFAFNYTFYSSSKEISPKKLGAFAIRGSNVFLLQKESRQVIDKIQEFNNLPEETKSKKEIGLIYLYEISKLSGNEFIKLGDFLIHNKIVVPEKVKLTIKKSDKNDELISILPDFGNEIDEQQFEKTYLSANQANTVYDIGSDGKNRIRIVLNEDIFKIVNHIRNMVHVGGEKKNLILTNPRELFDTEAFENIDVDSLIDFEYSKRVKGIGGYVFQSVPFIKRKSNDWFDFDSGDQAGFKCETIDGDSKDLTFKDNEDMSKFEEKLDSCLSSGNQTFEFEDMVFKYTDQLKEQFEELKREVMPKSTKNPLSNISGNENRYLLIFENEEDIEYSLPTDIYEDATELNFEQPKSLIQSIPEEFDGLKSYQKEGVARLQELFNRRRNRKGVLLADDMGLGKTLQVLTFLAWCIEGACPALANRNEAPFNEPILIIAPIILLKNWQDEIEKYFEFGGALFSPVKILDSSNIHKFKTESGTKEYKSGKNILRIKPDLNNPNNEYLLGYRTIITNYDTVKNYQHSFAKVNWSIIVVDEAQEIKNQKTSRSFALKSLKSIFKVVLSGTPIENRLIELWNLVDFFQPGLLLGSAKIFSNEYEVKDFDDDKEINEKTEKLRSRLKYNSKLPFVLRRDKQTYLSKELKKKITVAPEAGAQLCPLSEEERAWHLDIMREMKGGGSNAFQALHRLRALSLHQELLINEGAIHEPEYYIEKSSKLKKLIEVLTKIKTRKEKVLIFCISRRMQQILKEVIEHKFKIKLKPIVNGSLKTSTRYSREDRKGIIESFQQEEGFNVLILSPEVAGVGLNIVKANHVIHYERWWNPATENQATDRVYRLGQKKDVYVYYLVNTDPKNEFKTFDEKLNLLLEGKKNLATNFLMPTEVSRVTEKDFIDFHSDTFTQTKEKDSKQYSRITTLEDVRFLGHQKFEAFAACIFKTKGYSTILTPRVNDFRIDVLCFNSNEVLFVQCKHKQSKLPYDKDSIIEEIESGQTHYLNRFSELGNKRYKGILFTNGDVTKDIKDKCESSNIEVYNGAKIKDLLKAIDITTKDILDMEKKRVNNVNEIKLSFMKKVGVV